MIYFNIVNNSKYYSENKFLFEVLIRQQMRHSFVFLIINCFKRHFFYLYKKKFIFKFRPHRKDLKKLNIFDFRNDVLTDIGVRGNFEENAYL